MRAITVSLGKPYFLYLHLMYDCLREHPFFFFGSNFIRQEKRVLSAGETRAEKNA